MFRKRRRPTPHFKIPSPYNPIQGENANLRQDGVSPFCALMQVAEEDTRDDYVVCRGFDPRILRFMGTISVAKPFGKRKPDTYQIGEIYPAFLPTQGNANFIDFRQVTYFSPSPDDVLWRVGQNPGVAVGGLDGGQPENLDGEIEILYDDNDKVINWLLIDSNGESTPAIVFELTEQLERGVGELADATVVETTHTNIVEIDDEVEVFNTGDMFGLVGAHGVAIRFNDQWWVVDLNQQSILASFTFDSDTHGSSGTFGIVDQLSFTFNDFTTLTPYPFSDIPPVQVVNNPRNLIGFTGDVGLVSYNLNTGQYVLIDVFPALTREFYFALTADWPNGLDQTSTSAVLICPVPSHHGGDTSYGSITLRDRFDEASNAKGTGATIDVGTCQLNYKTGQFDIVNITHVCRRARAKVYTGFTGTPAAFEVTEVVGFDGRAPAADPLTVYNELNIPQMATDDPVEIRWNTVAGRYYAMPPASEGTGGTRKLQGTLEALEDGTGPYTGKKVGTVLVKVAPCEEGELIGTEVEVVDWSDCIFDLPFEDLDGVWVWVSEGVAESLDEGAEEGELTPCHWVADDRCCVGADGE